MSGHETRLLKASRVRMRGRPVRVGARGGGEKADDHRADSPDLEFEKDGEGRISCLVVHCTCGESIRVNCQYTGGEPDEITQA